MSIMKIFPNRTIRPAVAVVFFLALSYVVIWNGIFNVFSFELTFESGKEDSIAIYYPDSDGNYYEKNSVQERYNKGTQVLRLEVPLPNTEAPLRLDPGAKNNSLLIKSITVRQFRNAVTLQPADLFAHISAKNEVLVKTQAEGLQLVFKSGDPQLYLLNLPLPHPQFFHLWREVTGFGIVFFLLLTSFLNNSLTRYTIPWQVSAGIGFLILLGVIQLWPFWVMLALCGLFSFSIARLTLPADRPDRFAFSPLPAGAFLVSGLFCVLLIWPFYQGVVAGSKIPEKVLSVFTDNANSEEDKTLQKRLETMVDDIEKIVIHNFPLRKELIELNARIKISMLGYSPTSKAILGQNDMFFEGYGQRRVEADITGSFDNITDYMGLIPFSESELEQWRICLEERYFWLKERGIDYVFALAPTKALVYPENLPKRIYRLKTKLGKPTRYEQLVRYLKKNSVVPVVDLRRPLLKAKEKTSRQEDESPFLLYYRTDFHWNYYGAFLAYQAIIEEVNTSYPEYELQAASIEDFRIKVKTDWVHKAFINTLGLNPDKNRNETYLTFLPKEGSGYDKIANFSSKGISDYSLPIRKVEQFGPKRVGARVLKNEEGKIPLLFVIGDSFSEKFMGFFSKHAEKTISFRTVYSFQPEVYIDHSPDLVIQEVLNMYLLQSPPRNPPAIKGARKRYMLSEYRENDTRKIGVVD